MLLTIIMGLFVTFATYIVFVAIGDSHIAFPLAVFAGCAFSILLFTYILIVTKVSNNTRNRYEKQLKLDFFAKSKGLLKNNKSVDLITFYLCKDLLLIHFLENRKKEDISINYDDVDKIEIFVDSNKIVVKSKHNNDLILELFEFELINESMQEHNIQPQ